MAMPRNYVMNEQGLPRDIIGVGASAGGVEALTRLFADLSADLPASVFVVLHRSRSVETQLAAILARHAAIRVTEPQGGEAIAHGHVYVAPRDRHLIVLRDRIELDAGPRENFSRPAIDTLFRSLARGYGSRAVGVVLSGGGSDGTIGMLEIKAEGGLSIVQDPAEARYVSMPLTAIRHDHVDAILPLERIAEILNALAHGEPVRVESIVT
jgi:two-component system chemotaxis response regulator CheB